MAKIRVHEIAKELGKSSKEMVDILQKMGLDVKNHMSTVEDSQASWVRKQLTEAEKGKTRSQSDPAPPKTNGDVATPPSRESARSEPQDHTSPWSRQCRRSPTTAHPQK